MRTAIPLLLTLIFALSSATVAQDGKEHNIQLFGGINDYANKDKLVSPFIYTDRNYPIHLGYEVRNSEFIRSFEVNYFYGTATNDTDNKRETHSGFMRFGYLRSIPQPLEQFAIYVGGRIGSETIIDQASFSTSQKSYTTNSSGYYALSSGATVNIDYNINLKHSFSFNPYISIFGYVYRPGYSLYHHSSFREALKSASFSSYGDFLNISGRLAYQFQLSKRLELSLNYNFNYLRYAEPFEIRVLQNSMVLGVGVNL